MVNEIENLEPIESLREQKPSIKLSRTSKGLYSWELKILSLNISEIESLNNEMIKRFGEKKDEKSEKDEE